MPELPEVETVRRGLVPVMEGHRIESAEARRPDLRWPLPARMAERLTGARIDRLRRRSKYILADLDTAETLIVHLGMSGRIVIAAGVVRAALGEFLQTQPAPLVHDHVVIHMAGGARITFNDPRRFGAMDLCATDATDRHWLLAGIGPEPLGDAFTDAYLAGALRRRDSPVKSLLLDQKLVAGLGNIYVCEALHRAGVSPLRRGRNLSAARAARLVPAIRDVLTEAIAAGGSSLRDYRQTDGDLGYFQHAFRVYGRTDQPCQRPGCHGTIRRIVQSGRSTFYCPRCQR